MKPTITEVKPFGRHGWLVTLSVPGQRSRFRIRTTAQCPDELSAYVSVLKEIEGEDT